jgi:hypothetical protein
LLEFETAVANTAPTGGFDIETSFSDTYDNGGCDTLGIGHWEHND